jgi:hypothetical protein
MALPGKTHADALRRGLPPWKHGFNARVLHVGFFVNKVALAQVSLEYLDFPVPIIIFSVLFITILIRSKRDNSRNLQKKKSVPLRMSGSTGQ